MCCNFMLGQKEPGGGGGRSNGYRQKDWVGDSNIGWESSTGRGTRAHGGGGQQFEGKRQWGTVVGPTSRGKGKQHWVGTKGLEGAGRFEALGGWRVTAALV